MNKIIRFCQNLLLCLLVAGSLVSCKKYLDVKPGKKMVLPSTIADCQALLDNFQVMNSAYLSGEAYGDNYYLLYNNWNSLQPIHKDSYIWKADADINYLLWQTAYQTILYANQALETLGKISPSQSEKATWDQVKGAALFYRSFALYQTAQIWARPYDSLVADNDLGLPLRLTPDLNEKAGRSTVKEMYDRIIQDLQDAAGLLPPVLPTSNITKIRPSQAAVHALLARIYLAMGEYEKAFAESDFCLQNYHTLIDFNTRDTTSYAPFEKYNAEVIFHATTTSYFPLYSFYARIDSNLYRSYQAGDLRRPLFFNPNTGTPVTYQFKGNYDGGGSFASVFCGLATDEVYLVRAECYARAGNTVAAMADLNTLLRKRWKAPYTDRAATNADDALSQVLTERRKELLFRGLRWGDLRRLNKDPRFAVTLSRNLNGTIYTLPPNDLRYTLLIPQEVLKREPMTQNPR